MTENTARDLVARIKAEDPEPENPFDEFKHSPFEFRWIRKGGFGEPVDYTYEKRYLAKVVQARTTGSGGTRAARRASLSAMTFTCPECDTEHSILTACS